MASKPEQKPKRVPIVLNMHLLDKDDEKDDKSSKDSKEANANEKNSDLDKVRVGDETGKCSINKIKNEEFKSDDHSNKAKADEASASGPKEGKKNMSKSDGSKEERGICRDFLRNMCSRGDTCKFYHPSSGFASADRRRSSWLVLCHDFQNGHCMRSDCRYFHITREDETLYHTTGEIHPRVVDQVMRKALYVDIFSPGVRPSCKEFLKGNCVLPTCRFRHLDRREYEDEIFRSLQEEFQVVFGPPEKREISPQSDSYKRNQYQSSAWYDRPTYDAQDSLPPGDLRTTVLGQGGGFEPDNKRRRHYSDERSYQYPNSYRMNDLQRPWDERVDYDRRALPNTNYPVEMERMMQEISHLRNDKIEITRSMDQQILALRDEIALMTRENESLHQDNVFLRNSVNDIEVSNKAAVDSLMMTNDNLVEDNKQLKIALQNAESEVADARKMLGKKIDDLEKEKQGLNNALRNAKDAEQKLKDEVQRIKIEKEALQKIRDNLKAELERVNHQLSMNTTNQNLARKEQDQVSYLREDPKDDSFQKDSCSSRRPNFGVRGLNKAEKSAWSNNTTVNQQEKSDRQVRPDWQERPWADTLKNSDRRDDFTTEIPGYKQEGPWKSEASEKSGSVQSQSLLGEFPQPSSLLGQYPPSVGKDVIQALSEFGANKSQNSQPAKMVPSKVLGGQQVDLGLSQNHEGHRADFGPVSGQNGQRPEYIGNQGQRPDYGVSQRSEFGGGQRPDYGSGQRSDFRSNFGPDQRSDFGPNQGPGGRFDFGPNQSRGGPWASDIPLTKGQNEHCPDFGANRSQSGQWGDFTSSRTQGGHRGDMWNNRSEGQSRSNFWGSEKDPVNSSYMGPTRSRMGERDYGLSGYDNGMRDGTFGGGPDMCSSSSGSHRGNWLKDDDRLSTGRSRPGFKF
ncbi:golgin subfamily A member 6-like protein 2 [Macrobrachium rosenbergii]|uniref:golgin subfamily A member 6-like protein 2 n=1 Tax=Macrobrachium rosenbergii TaxID=79674 RepID=UPI0034D52953